VVVVAGNQRRDSAVGQARRRAGKAACAPVSLPPL
jgi:hypothetical protein